MSDSYSAADLRTHLEAQHAELDRLSVPFVDGLGAETEEQVEAAAVVINDILVAMRQIGLTNQALELS